MDRINIGIVGIDYEGLQYVDFFSKLNQVKLVGITDCDIDKNLIENLRDFSVPFFDDIDKFLNNDEIQVIIVTEASKNIFNKKHINKIKTKQLVINNITHLIQVIMNDREEIRKLKGELSAILNSVQEAIEVVDKNGFIKYVNPSFTRVTGISAESRIGKNLFAVSPFGALAKSLEDNKSIFGYRAKVGGSGVEVISNASPIIVDNEITGAVVVFQPINDLYKLLDELQKSNKIIENLYERIGQISGAKYTFKDLTGYNKKFKQTLAIAKKTATSDATVLVLGESGTGKELFAHAIHQASARRDKPFIKINCAAIPENLLESELFGYEKGAFTGAVKTKIGKMELANGGTIFLDEIGDMDIYLQAKLLRVLQEREIERVGGTQIIPIDVRIIAATNRNLLKIVEEGKFREDLYYRLNVVQLNIPPLRERIDDLEELANKIITKFNRKLGKNIKMISQEALKVFKKYEWPGNIRELENIIERAMVVVDGEAIEAKDIINYLTSVNIKFDNEIEKMDIIPLHEMEKRIIQKAIATYGDSLEGKKRVASELDISLATLYNKIKKYRINDSNN